VTVYIVAQIRFTDRTAYDRYQTRFMDVFGAFSGTLLAVDDKPAVVEGNWLHERVVIGSFPDEAAWRAWWDSPEYREIVEHRWAGSEAVILLVKGLA
jgi:uncharacterized protein (DUF1330 family)